jgi:hypothetical protein
MMRPHWLALGIAGMMIVTGAACASWPPGNILHPPAPPRPQVAAQCLGLPESARDHVHIFMVNGCDPCNLFNLRGLYDSVLALGFHQVHFGQMWHTGRFVKAIRRVRQEDPDARIVLLGYSISANFVRMMARDLNKDHTQIDLLVYLAGDYVRNSKAFKPDNVCRVLNIRGWGLVLAGGGAFFKGADIDGCENHNLGFVRHSCVPANQETLELLARELADLASGVPVHSAPAVQAAQDGASAQPIVSVSRCCW